MSTLRASLPLLPVCLLLLGAPATALAIGDAELDILEGRQVTLVLEDGTTKSGRLAGHDEDLVFLSTAEDGEVEIARRTVRQMRLDPGSSAPAAPSGQDPSAATPEGSDETGQPPGEITDAGLRALHERRVAIEMRDGSRLEGRLAGHDDTRVTLASQDGSTMDLPRDAIRSIRMPTAAPVPTPLPEPAESRDPAEERGDARTRDRETETLHLREQELLERRLAALDSGVILPGTRMDKDYRFGFYAGGLTGAMGVDFEAGITMGLAASSFVVAAISAAGGEFRLPIVLAAGIVFRPRTTDGLRLELFGIGGVAFHDHLDPDGTSRAFTELQVGVGAGLTQISATGAFWGFRLAVAGFAFTLGDEARGSDIPRNFGDSMAHFYLVYLAMPTIFGGVTF